MRGNRHFYVPPQEHTFCKSTAKRVLNATILASIGRISLMQDGIARLFSV